MLPKNWSKYIKNLERVDRDLERRRTIFVGATPYTRIVPAFFMKNYEIFCLKDCKEISHLREYADIHCLEQGYPSEIDQIKSTTELMQHPLFHEYVKKYRGRYSVLLYMMGGVLNKTLMENKIHYLANHPMIARDVLYKATFRKILKELKLPTLPDKLMEKVDFLKTDYNSLAKEFGKSFVCQRGNYDTGGQRGTFFVHQAKDLETVKENYQKESNFTNVQISKFIKGNSLSMIGCITQSGVLASSLQTQLIDIPEILDGDEALGQFLGHDWGNQDFTKKAEAIAETVTKTLGKYLYEKKFRGIFGLDFMYDPKKPDEIYPIECNPRFTGSFPLISLLMLEQGLPPFELFHILEHKKVNFEVDVEALNKLYKNPPVLSNVYISAHKVVRMPVDMEQGIYKFDEAGNISYARPGVFPWHIKSQNEFLAIDNIFAKDYPLMQEVSRLFRLVFPVRISKSSDELLPLFSHIVKSFIQLINYN